ncbi:hypothetical protein M9Y10_010902 [Tritrichomonas musculus]|uniref:Condensation domain-containing protein n=1 Tax=Tritrichomonas musculus TaxID=1915356 RepID=A0ABR2IM30_9EUKA
MLKSRPLTSLEKLYSQIIPINVQLGIEVCDKSIIPTYIKRIQDFALVMHLRTDKDNLYHTDEVAPINKLPEDLPTLKDAVTYVLKNCKTADSFPLANISVNSKYLVFNSCHSFCDGKLLTRIIEQIQNPVQRPMPLFPTPIVINFADQVKKAPVLSHDYRDPIITHLKNIVPKKADPNDVFQNIYDKIDVKDLACYHNGKVSDLTDQFGIGLILASKALSNNQIDDGFGCQSAINLRPYLPGDRGLDLDIVDHVGISVLTSKNPKTVRELKTDLRSSFVKSEAQRNFFGHMKWDIEHYVNGGESEFPLTGLANVVSHIGPVKIRRPITDIMMRVDMEEPFEMVSVVPYSVMSETENSVRTHLVYGSNGISKDQMERFGRLFNHVMTKLDLDTPINDAIDILRDIDSKH